MKSCVACGEQIENSEDYCLFCGAPQIKVGINKAQSVEEKKATTPTQPKQKKRLPKEVEDDSRQQAKQERERQKREKEEKLKKDYEEALYRSTHDVLTNIGNRTLFEDVLAKYNEKRCWVAYIDVNDFKDFNDQHSHDTGDMALKVVANALCNVFGAESSYRIGGDEFAIILDEVQEEELVAKIDLFKEELSNAQISDDITGIKVAVGYSYCDGIMDIQEAIKEADHKMYEDKAAQKPKQRDIPSDLYEDNADGYYNDIEPDMSEVEKNYAKVSIKRIAILVVIGIALLVLDQFM